MSDDLTKIRIKCAEIVGWKSDGRYENSLRDNRFYGSHPDSGIKWRPCPNYPESADAALELVAWMAKPENGGWCFYCDRLNDRVWNMSFSSMRKQGNALADTLPLAICLAFLKANGINPETL